jgi:hypothetical protein
MAVITGGPPDAADVVMIPIIVAEVTRRGDMLPTESAFDSATTAKPVLQLLAKGMVP